MELLDIIGFSLYGSLVGGILGYFVKQRGHRLVLEMGFITALGTAGGCGGAILGIKLWGTGENRRCTRRCGCWSQHRSRHRCSRH
ncbi:hypothetical protein SAMN05444392_12412 [Seinonella peptonophila]|uniref:Uncharacterized protein n=1 Tax=Seinonella peptonophila TaxID=112248 RepID=A0A1M5BI18_9BACL|nr:hypothetical protein [Seinonella peptonophila]SHF42115.1 hypothetical protein SAMN05444392_12412 [Seinonella peptonophila]